MVMMIALNIIARVFFSSCNSVQYHAELLNYIDIPVMSIHGKQKQQRRTAVFLEFVNASKGVLLCTDVAARGLDIPSVDWIIQFDPADDPKEYIHRVGRTARGEKGAGRALMFLLPDVGDVHRDVHRDNRSIIHIIFNLFNLI